MQKFAEIPLRGNGKACVAAQTQALAVA